MQKSKMGGKKNLSIFFAESSDVVDSLLSTAAGGRRLQRGLKEVIQEKYPGISDIEIVGESWHGQYLAPPNSQLFSRPFDIAVFSVQPAVLGSADAQQFQRTFLSLIPTIKEQVGAHILVYNCCSIDPHNHTHTYYGRPDTFSLRVDHFNLALIKLSVLEGISIIDVERVIGVLGADDHVQRALEYSDESYRAICDEFVRVLEDIGFFEERPLLMQKGTLHSPVEQKRTPLLS